MSLHTQSSSSPSVGHGQLVYAMDPSSVLELKSRENCYSIYSCAVKLEDESFSLSLNRELCDIIIMMIK